MFCGNLHAVLLSVIHRIDAEIESGRLNKREIERLQDAKGHVRKALDLVDLILADRRKERP